MSKRILICTTIFVLLFANMITDTTDKADSNNIQSSAINFYIQGDTIQSLAVGGSNQYNQYVTWQWNDAVVNNWSTGAISLTPQDQNGNVWWWQGTVVLDFYGTNIGHHTCIIDDLAVIPGGAVPVTYTPESNTCTGEAGSGGTPTSVKMALQYFLGDADSNTLLDAASQEDDALGCTRAIINGLAQATSTISVVWECRGAASDVIFQTLENHGYTVK